MKGSKYDILMLLFLLLVLSSCSTAQQRNDAADLSRFWETSHQWYDINDDDKIITPLPDKPRYLSSEIAKIADNVLLFQKSNGGWPKNYDMRAILTDEQREAVEKSRNETNTTFDNGATYTQVEYLAKVFSLTQNDRYKDGCLRGIDFILTAQYDNGGWPQFHPDTRGYRKYITFNDGAMIGVMNLLREIVNHEPEYAFVDEVRRSRVRNAFGKGIDCILKCQIEEDGVKSVWCQQHDDVDFRPQAARSFEPAAICNQESAEIILFLMKLTEPGPAVTAAVQSAVEWFRKSVIHGLRVQTVSAPATEFIYRKSSDDRIAVADSSAPPIWPRFSELNTHRPLFCNRDGKPVYSLAEVERERRVGYAWYTHEPQKVLDRFPEWFKRASETK
ncbi:MAG: pectate lyase [Bacteroidetes bacterium]|nr:pectate lyase [Bacteroidota bacterium]MCW5896920.1 pectate lyase [Bacteroidota bacterium]